MNSSKTWNARNIFYFPTLRRGRGGIHYGLKVLFIVTSEDDTTHTQIQNCTYM